MQDILGLDFFDLTNNQLKFVMMIWSLIKCVVLLVICLKLSKWLANKIFNKIVLKIENQERRQQLLTLKNIISHVLVGLILAVFGMNILYICGIDIKPLLATAGVMGVAVGFGAKRSVEDIISGAIIIIQGQLRVGDYVEINNMEGTVEKVTLPLISIRNVTSGAVHFIRCGCIDTIINHTMNFSYATFKFDVAYKENLDNVFRVIKESFKILVKQNEFAKFIIGELEIFGLDEFKESSLSIRCRIKTQPNSQWTIKRAFNKIIKEQFDKENIEIPFNQIVVTQNN